MLGTVPEGLTVLLPRMRQETVGQPACTNSPGMFESCQAATHAISAMPGTPTTAGLTRALKDAWQCGATVREADNRGARRTIVTA